MILAGHAGDAATARAHLADPDPAVRAAALSALARADALDRQAVLDALADPDPSVRRRALEDRASQESHGAEDLLEPPPADE